MKKKSSLQKKIILNLAVFLAIGFSLTAQKDSTRTPVVFSGSVGITNNGFSIIPTFSLNSPATIINLSWKKNRFSLEPDIRLVPSLNKGGLLFWLRYKLVESKKFNLRLGTHPALSLVRKEAILGETPTQITEMLRFAAVELVPSYQLTSKIGIGAMYLRGFGLQSHGPQRTKVLFLNMPISNIKIGKDLRFMLVPNVYFLDLDKFRGDYFSALAVLGHTKLPFNISANINQTFKSNIPGNRNFMWNVGLNYTFRQVYAPISKK